MKTIHLTDVHLTCPGEQIYGLDPRARLDAAVAELKGEAEHPFTPYPAPRSYPIHRIRR